MFSLASTDTVSPKTTPPNEAELISLYHQTGDLGYIGELYKKFTPLVYGVCQKYLQNPEDSQDALMQIFEKLLIDAPHHIDNWSAWLYTVARNHCLMILRKKKLPTTGLETKNLENRMELSEVLHLPDESKELRIQRLHQAMAQLPSEQENCMRLFFFEEKTYKEIALLTGYEVAKVKSYLQNGKRMLKILLEKK